MKKKEKYQLKVNEGNARVDFHFVDLAIVVIALINVFAFITISIFFLE